MENPISPEAESNEDASGGDVVVTPPVASPAAAATPSPPPAATPVAGEAEGKKSEAAPPRVPLCSAGDVLKGKWKVIKQIGMGAFGEIYLGQNVASGEKVAIKAEPITEERQALRTETTILRKLQECPYVGRFISCGRQGEVNYLVMQLLGENLAELRKRQYKSMFSIPTVCRLAIDMVLALQSIHDLGILHRDVKPSNFVLDMPVGTEDRVYLYIIDFGLSRKYIGIDGEIKPPRDNPGFRGTARYASVYSHACKDLAPRDDLWSVYYILAEFALGSLPWSKIHDRDKVAEMKKEYLSGTRLVNKLPAEFADLQKYLETLDYYSLPDYQYILDLFLGLLERTTGTTDFPPYDWERERARKRKKKKQGKEHHAKRSASPTPAHHPNKSSTYGSSSGKSPAGTGEEPGNDYRWIFKTRRVKSYNVPVGSPYVGPAPTGFSSSSESDHGKSKGTSAKKSGASNKRGSENRDKSSSSDSDSDSSSDSDSDSSSSSGTDSDSSSSSGSDSSSESDTSSSDSGEDHHHHHHHHHKKGKKDKKNCIIS